MALADYLHDESRVVEASLPMQSDKVAPGGPHVRLQTGWTLAAKGKPALPDGITFHSLRRTYAALRAELGNTRRSRQRRWATGIRG
jgi:integrase